jgi:hypothetical protein
MTGFFSKLMALIEIANGIDQRSTAWDNQRGRSQPIQPAF